MKHSRRQARRERLSGQPHVVRRPPRQRLHLVGSIEQQFWRRDVGPGGAVPVVEACSADPHVIGRRSPECEEEHVRGRRERRSPASAVPMEHRRRPIDHPEILRAGREQDRRGSGKRAALPDVCRRRRHACPRRSGVRGSILPVRSGVDRGRATCPSEGGTRVGAAGTARFASRARFAASTGNAARAADTAASSRRRVAPPTIMRPQVPADAAPVRRLGETMAAKPPRSECPLTARRNRGPGAVKLGPFLDRSRAGTTGASDRQQDRPHHDQSRAAHVHHRLRPFPKIARRSLALVELCRLSSTDHARAHPPSIARP